MLSLLTPVAALLIIWGLVLITTRWSPYALGFYPHGTIGSAAMYIVLAFAFPSVEGAAAREQMMVLLHACFAGSSLCWWWTALRMAQMHGRPLRLPRALTHVLPVVFVGVPLVFGFAGVPATFVSHGPPEAFVYHLGWYVLVVSLTCVSIATITLGLQRAWTASVAEDRLQFACVAAVTVAPMVLGAVAAIQQGPLELMSIGYGISCAIIIVAMYYGQMAPGLGLSLDEVWATDPTACLVLDRYNRLVYANESAKKLLAEAKGRGKPVGEWLSAAVTGRNGEPIDIDTLLSDQESASTRLLRLRSVPERLFVCETRLLRARGAVIGRVLSLRDETTHEKFREAALAARRMESLSHMAGSVAHRFNNLLVSVVGNVDIAKYEIEQDSLNHQSVREILHDIQAAGQQAAELAKQLVTFTGNQLGHKEALDLNLTVHEALALIGKRLPARVRCDVALAASHLMVQGDRSQLIELVLNLVSNAQEAYADAGGSIRVTTGFRTVREGDLSGIYNRGAMRPGEYAFIEVTDHGPGLPADLADRLFDPFVTTKDDAQGLGLATVLGTAIAHEGGVEVRSDGRGSSFTIYLPQLPTTDKADDSEHVTVGPVSRESCLVVDDHPEVLNVHRAMLESLGRQAVATTSPTHALEMARMYRFELALVDVSMPELRGDELVALMREVDPDLPVILVSGYADEQAEAERMPGRTVFIEKPFGLTELHDAILEVTRPAAGSVRAEVISLSLVHDKQD